MLCVGDGTVALAMFEVIIHRQQLPPPPIAAQDIAATCFGSGIVISIENLGSGARLVPSTLATSLVYPHTVAAADFGRDGFLDLVVASRGGVEVPGVPKGAVVLIENVVPVVEVPALLLPAGAITAAPPAPGDSLHVYITDVVLPVANVVSGSALGSTSVGPAFSQVGATVAFAGVQLGAGDELWPWAGFNVVRWAPKGPGALSTTVAELFPHPSVGLRVRGWMRNLLSGHHSAKVAFTAS